MPLGRFVTAARLATLVTAPGTEGLLAFAKR